MNENEDSKTVLTPLLAEKLMALMREWGNYICKDDGIDRSAWDAAGTICAHCLLVSTGTDLRTAGEMVKRLSESKDDPSMTMERWVEEMKDIGFILSMSFIQVARALVDSGLLDFMLDNIAIMKATDAKEGKE